MNPSGSRNRSNQATRVTRAYRKIDRLLGGDEPPTRTQEFAARRPAFIGLCAGLVTLAACLLLSLGGDDSGATSVAYSLLFGALMGGLFTAVCFAERKRQARLNRTE